MHLTRRFAISFSAGTLLSSYGQGTHPAAAGNRLHTGKIGSSMPDFSSAGFQAPPWPALEKAFHYERKRKADG
jgi:hypothetical protein